MARFDRITSGGTSISGGSLAPRSQRGSTNQVNSYWSGGGGANPPVTVEVLAAGGGQSGEWNIGFSQGYPGGGGGYTTYNATTPVSAGVQYTITVGGQSGTSSAVLGATVSAAGATTRVANGTGGAATSSTTAGNAGSGGSSANSMITGVSRGHGGGGGGACKNGSGYGGGGGNGGAGGVGGGLANGEGGYRGGGGGGASDTGGGVGGGGGGGEVIIAYPSSFSIASATTGSPSYSGTSRAGYHVYIFTGSGSITF